MTDETEIKDRQFSLRSDPVGQVNRRLNKTPLGKEIVKVTQEVDEEATNALWFSNPSNPHREK